MDITDKFHISKAQRLTILRYRRQAGKITKAILNNRLAVVGLTIILLFVTMAIFAPQLAPHGPEETVYTESGQAATLEPPTAQHPMGTTHVAKDIFSQWILGSRVSLMVGFLSGLSVVIVGSTVGIVSGFYKGKVDLILMRVVDILYGIPATPLILILALLWGSSIWNIIIAYVLVLWRTMARIIRAQTLSLSERPFVKSARASGASDIRIMALHIAPNLLPLIFIEATFVVGSAIVFEAGISFLGVGAQDMVSWGTMLQLTFVTGTIRSAWWWVLPPGIAITLLVLSFFYVSRALEEITNPEEKRFG